MRLLPYTMLRSAAILVPRERRAEWLAEWKAELWYVSAERAVAFCWGAYRDALWLRRNDPSADWRGMLRMESPWRCLGYLAILAAVSAWLAFRLPGARQAVLPCMQCAALARQSPLLAQLIVILIALAILPATTSLELGEYPAGRGACHFGFLALKIAILMPAVFFGVLDLAAVSSTPIQAHGFLVGYVLALRWALIDQRKRCPVCLRLLSHPTRIGRASQTLLEWYGTELICTRGHGLMHVPEIRTSCYSVQRWLRLDSSWSSLFSPRRTR